MITTLGWLGICGLCSMAGGFAGVLVMSMIAANKIKELTLWNRRLRDQRDEAMKKVGMYEELLKIEQ
jgi:hypothetical protein